MYETGSIVKMSDRWYMVDGWGNLRVLCYLENNWAGRKHPELRVENKI